MNTIKWYGNDNDNSIIIAYGDVNGKRVFKIAFEKNQYVCYRFIEKVYEKIYSVNNQLLPHCQEFCANFDLNTPISDNLKFVVIAENRSDKKRVQITNPSNFQVTKDYKPTKFDKMYYRYFHVALAD